MKILGISSAIDIVGAAVAGDTILAEHSLSSKILRSEKLTVLIDELLNKLKLKIKDVDAVAVTTGPGSYSGLRGGVATAKGLVEALNIPIIAVPTLEAIAFNFIDIQGTTAIAINACKDDYNFALFASNNGRLKRLTEDVTVHISKIESVLLKVKGSLTLACDEKLKKLIKNPNISLAEQKNTIAWAINVARIGLIKYNNKETSDYIELAPSYSHKPNIREHKK